MEIETVWDVDCSVRIDDVADVRSVRKGKDGMYVKSVEPIIFKFDETGATISCEDSLKKIEVKDMPHFLAKYNYEVQLDGIVLDYFLTTFEDSFMNEKESAKQLFRFRYCKESGKSSFSYDAQE